MAAGRDGVVAVGIFIHRVAGSAPPV